MQDALARHISLHLLFCFLVRAGVYFDFLIPFDLFFPELVSQNFSSKRLVDETFSFLKKNGQIFLHCINAI